MTVIKEFRLVNNVPELVQVISTDTVRAGVISSIDGHVMYIFRDMFCLPLSHMDVHLPDFWFCDPLKIYITK